MGGVVRFLESVLFPAHPPERGETSLHFPLWGWGRRLLKAVPFRAGGYGEKENR